MTLTLPATTNETSFAVAYADATALVLDGIAEIGGIRKLKFELAARRLDKALAYADIPEEELLARQLVSLLQVYKLKGLNV